MSQCDLKTREILGKILAVLKKHEQDMADIRDTVEGLSASVEGLDDIVVRMLDQLSEASKPKAKPRRTRMTRERALQILAYVRDGNGARKVSEMTGIPVSTCSKVIRMTPEEIEALPEEDA